MHQGLIGSVHLFPGMTYNLEAAKRELADVPVRDRACESAERTPCLRLKIQKRDNAPTDYRALPDTACCEKFPVRGRATIREGRRDPSAGLKRARGD